MLKAEKRVIYKDVSRLGESSGMTKLINVQGLKWSVLQMII